MTRLAELWASSHVPPPRRYEWPRWWIWLAALVEGVTEDAMRDRLRVEPCDKSSDELFLYVFTDL